MKWALNPSSQTRLFIFSSFCVVKSCDSVGCFQLQSVDGESHSKHPCIAHLGLWSSQGLWHLCQPHRDVSDTLRHLRWLQAVSVKPCMTNSFRHKISSLTMRFMLFLSQQPWYYWNILELKKKKKSIFYYLKPNKHCLENCWNLLLCRICLHFFNYAVGSRRKLCL